MIYVFKTNVETQRDVKLLEPHLDRVLADAQWNFDLEDCDCILRIENRVEIGHAVITLLNNNGFECRELGD